MKRLFLVALAAFCTAAFGTTLSPVQLLNPAGSTSGQTIVSTGSSTAPAWGNVSIASLTGVLPVANGGTNSSSASGTALDNISGFSSTGFLTRTGAGAYAFQSATNGITLGNLAQAGANTILANATGSTANVTAFSMPSCTGSTNALGYTSGTGIVCNGSINAATLGGATFANPGAIGATPGSGAFTTLSATTTNSSSSLTVTDTGTSGANIKLLGNGGTTPSKTMRVFSGTFQILNNAYTTPIFSLTDAGAMSAATLSATGFARLNYGNSSSQSIPASTLTTITNWTAVNDDNSNFTASTGTFTAPNTGWYLVSGQALFTVAAGAINNQFQILVVANGVTVETAVVTLDAAATSIAVPFSVAVKMTAAQTLLIRAYQTSSGAQTLNSSSTGTVLSIVELP